MSLGLLASVVGFSMLAFRLWLVERKLVDELQFRRRYLSRVINYYSWLSIGFLFQVKPVNWVVVTAFPILVVTSIWDLRFYRRYSGRTYWQKNRHWMLVERLTLHPPTLAIGLFMIIMGAGSYVTDTGFQPIWLGIALIVIPFVLLDERWVHHYNWPQAPIIVVLWVFATLFMAMAQVLVWGVPLL